MKTIGYVILAAMMFLVAVNLARRIGDATSDVMGRTMQALEPKK